MADKTFLFNPVGLVHYRNIGLFEEALGKRNIRCILNPRFPWFADRKNIGYGHYYFSGDRVPERAFEGVKAVIVFSAQPRRPSTHLNQEAAFRSIPVIAIQEVYQMMLEQGYVSEYFLPVDHLFVCSEYERQKFLEIGVPGEVAETTGCIFNYNTEALTDKEAEELKGRLGLASGKKVATLGLAYQTPSGETLEIRKRLLEKVSGLLPAQYQLLVKPHPAEQDGNIAEFIKRHAPAAIVADRYLQIGKVLSVTDLLINRGNSQVVVDALRRKIPVVLVPVGRKTFFEGVLDDLIINDKAGLERALGIIDSKGFGIYAPIFDRFLSVDADTALKKVISRIDEIAERNEIRAPGERLAEISLYWAFMGYLPQSLRIQGRIKTKMKDAGIMPVLDRLVRGHVAPADISSLRDYAGKGYREWVIKSLLIKDLFFNDKKAAVEDLEWMKGFPPRMNREYFMQYACMLGWCYIRAGLRTECERLLGDIYAEYSFLDGVKGLREAFDDRSGFRRGPNYWRTVLGHRKDCLLRNVAWELSGFRN